MKIDVCDIIAQQEETICQQAEMIRRLTETLAMYDIHNVKDGEDQDERTEE